MTATAIDDEVRQLLDNSQREAETILFAHRSALEAMTDELLEQETLDVEDIARLLAGVPKWRREEGGNGVLRRGPEQVTRGAAA